MPQTIPVHGQGHLAESCNVRTAFGWPLLHRERHRHRPAFFGNPLESSLRFLSYSSPLPRDDAIGREKIQEELKCFAFTTSQAQSQSFHAKTCPITTYAHKPLKQMSSRGKLDILYSTVKPRYNRSHYNRHFTWLYYIQLIIHAKHAPPLAVDSRVGKHFFPTVLEVICEPICT